MKNNKQMLLNILLAITVVATQIGCGKKSGGDVKLKFANNTASTQAAEYEAVGLRGVLSALSVQASSLLGVTPTIFQMKLVAFYIVEAIDAETGNNRGAGAHIWTNKNCDSDLTYCGINAEHANGYLADYFDFAKGSAAVNAEFNSYKRDTKDSQIEVGTYNYIRMDFTGKVFSDSDKTPNLKFGTQQANEVRAQSSALLVKLPAPLVIEKGESFTVDLAYSLDNSYYASGTYNQAPSEVSSSDTWTCNGTTSNIPCIVEVKFVPTVTKN